MSMKKNFIQAMAQEAQQYTSAQKILSLVQDKASLKDIPFLPLFSVLSGRPIEEKGHWWPLLSVEQKKAMLDMDLWRKDTVDPYLFSSWVQSIGKLKRESDMSDFALSPQFSLYLKARVNIATFDTEDPLYPDHDYYFLTDDSLLIIEYDEHLEELEELRRLIRIIYSELGVEKAYRHLFKLISSSFLQEEEEEYRLKTERLREFGILDYYEALGMTSSLPSIGHAKAIFKNSSAPTGQVEARHKNQILSLDMASVWKQGPGPLIEGFNQLGQERQDFLRFQFITLVHAHLSASQALNSGKLAKQRLSEQMALYLSLGHGLGVEENQNNPLEAHDFIQLFKIGKTLVERPLRQLKKKLCEAGFEGDKEKFLGDYLNQVLDASFKEHPRLIENYRDEVLIEDYPTWKKWQEQIELTCAAVDIAKGFYKGWVNVRIQLGDHCPFLNYQVEDVDFETLFMTGPIGHKLGEQNLQCPGVSLTGAKDFLQREDRLIRQDLSPEGLYSFLNSDPGLNQKYIVKLLEVFTSEHFQEVDFSGLEEDEWPHIAGVLILKEGPV